MCCCMFFEPDEVCKTERILILCSVFFTLVPPVSTCFFQQIKINPCRTDKCIAIMTNMTYCRAKHNKLSIINSSIPLAVPSLASAFWFTNLMSIRRNNRLFHFMSSSVLLVFVWTSRAIEDLMVLYGYSLYIRTYIQYQSVFVPYGNNYHHTRPYSQYINMQEHTTSQNTDIYLEDPS